MNLINLRETSYFAASPSRVDNEDIIIGIFGSVIPSQIWKFLTQWQIYFI